MQAQSDKKGISSYMMELAVHAIACKTSQCWYTNTHGTHEKADTGRQSCNHDH